MKATSASTLTLVLIGSLLAGSGICVALRHSADERRSTNALTTSSDHPSNNSTSAQDRESSHQRTTRTRITDRESFRQRLLALLTSSDSMTRSQNLLELLDGLNPSDYPIIIQEMKKVCRNGDPMLRLVFSAWAEADPAAALQQELKNKRLEKSSVLEVWAQRDPIAALDWLGKSTVSKSPQLIDQVLTTLAIEDPATALAWTKDHDDLKHARLATVLRSMLPKHLDQMIHECSLLSEDTRKEVIAPISKQIGIFSEKERTRWLESLPSDEEKIDAAAAMISGMESIVDRLHLVAEYPAALERPESAVLYQQWVREDESAALASLANLPPGPARNAAVDSAVLGLVQNREPRKALDLMNRHPEAVTQAMLHIWASFSTSNHREWDLVLTTLPRVGNERSRESLYRFVLGDWIRSDQKSARAWLNSHPEVPDSVRTAYAAP